MKTQFKNLNSNLPSIRSTSADKFNNTYLKSSLFIRKLTPSYINEKCTNFYLDLSFDEKTNMGRFNWFFEHCIGEHTNYIVHLSDKKTDTYIGVFEIIIKRITIEYVPNKNIEMHASIDKLYSYIKSIILDNEAKGYNHKFVTVSFLKLS